MAGTVNLPFIGPTNTWVVGVAGVAGIGALGYAYLKKKKAAATPAAVTSLGTTPAGYGYGYGSYGYGAYSYQPYGYGFGSSGLGAYGGATGNYGYGYYGAGEPTAPVSTQATTNAQWSEAVVSALTSGSAGWTGQDVLTALGLYLTGAPVSANQESIIRAAIAAEGYPPTAGANGYPPAIHSAAPVGQSGGGTTSTQVTVPKVTGQPQEAAFAILSAAGLHATGTALVPGKTLIVQSQSPSAGSNVATGTTVKLTSKVM